MSLNKELNKANCSSCKTDRQKDKMIRVVIDGTSWHFCDWVCLYNYCSRIISSTHSGGKR